MPIKVLLVDDDESSIALAKKYLLGRAYAVVTAHDGSDGLLLAQESKPDIVILDVEMPGLDGNSLCRVLKRGEKTSALPVILMSGRKIEEKDVLLGLAGGADDYLLKPVSLPVLAAKIETVLRRYAAPVKSAKTLKRSGVDLDPAGRTVKVGGKKVALARKEFDLLAVLLEKAGRVLSIPYLLETVWGYDPAHYNDPSTVEVHVSRLRRKLGARAGALIVNSTGNGYKFEP